MTGNRILCDLCSAPAVYLDRTRDSHLCKEHLIGQVEKEVKNYLNKLPDLPQTIGIAFSGGKDSTSLLKVLSCITDEIPCKFIALTVDEGIDGYREDTIKAARETCKILGVSHHIIRFSDLFGSSLDNLVSGSDRNACTICGILRRRALEILAQRHGIRVIATGHNLDDHAQTAVMNAISGDTKKIFTGLGSSQWYAKRIKPFAHVSEREVTLYAMLTGMFRNLPECPYAITSLRGEVRSLLYQYERKHPGSMKNAAKCEEILREKFGNSFEREPYRVCSRCGWPGSGNICQVCNVLDNDRTNSQ
ncbi:MAG: TIGR00269 family protein [Methanomicrobiales archaeon]|nr:TIGR00269 family protein [Methanomicrobiales archaeon]